MSMKRKLEVQQAQIDTLKQHVTKLTVDMVKLNSNVAALASMDFEEPQPKVLDQSIFNGLDEKWRFAAVDADGSARAYNYNQMPIGGSHEPHPNQSEKGFEVYKFIGTGYDTSNWQNSLIKRESKPELTGSDLCRAMLKRGDKLVMCIVSDDRLEDDYHDVITSYDGVCFKSSLSFWYYATPINNNGEPLTASEVGL